MEEEVERKNNLGLYLVIIALLVGAIIIFGVKMSYTATEEYTVSEQYDVDLKYEIIDSYKTTIFKGVFDVYAMGVVKVRNVDSETGAFTVTQEFKTLEDRENTFSSTQYVMPGEIKEFQEEYDIKSGEDFTLKYSTIPGTKKATRLVTKTRTVIKYATLFNQWTGQAKTYYEI